MRDGLRLGFTMNQVVAVLMLCLALVFVSAGCDDAAGTRSSHRQHEREVDVPPIRHEYDLYRTHVVPIDNANRRRFGFEAEFGPVGSGPRAVAVDSATVYVTDNFHNNIKVVDVHSGMLRTLDIPMPASEPGVDGIAVAGRWLIVANRSRRLYWVGIDAGVVAIDSLPDSFWRSQQFFEHDSAGILLVCPTAGLRVRVWPRGRPTFLPVQDVRPLEVDTVYEVGERWIVGLSDDRELSVDSIDYIPSTEINRSIAVADRWVALLAVREHHVRVELYERASVAER